MIIVASGCVGSHHFIHSLLFEVRVVGPVIILSAFDVDALQDLCHLFTSQLWVLLAPVIQFLIEDDGLINLHN